MTNKDVTKKNSMRKLERKRREENILSSKKKSFLSLETGSSRRKK